MALSIDDAIARLQRLRREEGGAGARVIIEVLPAERHVLSPPRVGAGRSDQRATGRGDGAFVSDDDDEAEPRRVSPHRHPQGGRFEGASSPPQVTVSRGPAAAVPTSPYRPRQQRQRRDDGAAPHAVAAAEEDQHQAAPGGGGAAGWAYSYQVPKDAFGSLRGPEAGPIAEGDAMRREESVRRAERSPSRLGGTASPARRDGQASVGRRLGAVPVFRYNPRDFESSAPRNAAAAATAPVVADRRLTSPPPPRGEARSVSPGRRGASPGGLADSTAGRRSSADQPTMGRMDFAAVGANTNSSVASHVGGWRVPQEASGPRRIELRSVSPSRGGGDATMSAGHHTQRAPPLPQPRHMVGGHAAPFQHTGPSHHGRGDTSSSRPGTPRRAASAPRAATPRGKRRFPHVQSTIQRPPPVEQEPTRMSSAFGGATGGGGSGGFFAMNSAAPGSDARSVSPRRRAASKGVAWVV